MKRYINKDDVVAEIERRKHKLLDTIIRERDKEWVVRTVHQLNRIILFLNTLEVKEVDLEKEIYDAEKRFGDIDEMGGYRILIFDDDFRDILRHFYELGLKVKGE